ncbi:MAG: efflux transporter outer membrane subunit [Acidovorax sp.]
MLLRRPLFLVLAGGLILSGCAELPTVPDPGIAVPSAWRSTSPAGEAVTPDWWRCFGSAELDGVVRRALAGSTDLAAAVARVHQASAQARIAGAGLWPTVDLNASAGRQTGGAGSVTDGNGNSFAAGLSASYGIDFWGRNRALRDAAQASLRASGYDRDTVRLTVVGGAASLWLQTVALRERAAIAARSLELARQTLALVQAQARAGAASPLDVAQQRGLVASQQRGAEALGQAARDSETTLAVWLGLPVGQLGIAADTLGAVALPHVDAGVPSALLTRRPDIARAEAQLAAADANIAAARAAMLPGLTLSASAGYASDTAHTLFSTPLYSIAAGLAAPIFDAGRLRGARDLALAQREELLAGYHGAIVSAFADVDKALNAAAGLDAQGQAQDEALAQARRAYVLAQSRYRAGAETMLTVLTAQQTLFAAQDLAVQLKQARLQAAVALYQALGGGWQEPASELPAGNS